MSATDGKPETAGTPATAGTKATAGTQATAVTLAKVGTPTAGPTEKEVFQQYIEGRQQQQGRKQCLLHQRPTVDSSHITDYNQVS
jgi:hypothetical protein